MHNYDFSDAPVPLRPWVDMSDHSACAAEAQRLREQLRMLISRENEWHRFDVEREQEYGQKVQSLYSELKSMNTKLVRTRNDFEQYRQNTKGRIFALEAQVGHFLLDSSG